MSREWYASISAYQHTPVSACQHFTYVPLDSVTYYVGRVEGEASVPRAQAVAACAERTERLVSREVYRYTRGTLASPYASYVVRHRAEGECEYMGQSLPAIRRLVLPYVRTYLVVHMTKEISPHVYV